MSRATGICMCCQQRAAPFPHPSCVCTNIHTRTTDDHHVSCALSCPCLSLGHAQCHIGTTTVRSRFEDIGHSPDARKTLEEYIVGEIEGYVPPAPDASGSGEGSNMMMIVAVLLVLAAVGAAMAMQ